MNERDRINQLEAENAKLKEDNRILQNTVDQLRVTLNRLIQRYVSGGKETA